MLQTENEFGLLGLLLLVHVQVLHVADVLRPDLLILDLNLRLLDFQLDLLLAKLALRIVQLLELLPVQLLNVLDLDEGLFRGADLLLDLSEQDLNLADFSALEELGG